jgi:hypothetical protein
LPVAPIASRSVFELRSVERAFAGIDRGLDAVVVALRDLESTVAITRSA